MTTSEKAAIEGIVVNAETREPVKKARVALYSMGSRNRPPEVLTGAAGRFAFTGLTPGQYNLSAERHGYVRQMYGQRHPAMFGHGTPLALEPGQHLRDIVFELLPAAVITGRVLDEDRDPLPGAQVQALRELPALSHDQMFPVGHAVTNDLGDYRITGLAPGSYRVSGNCQVAALTYGPTYYPNMSQADHAAVIEVAAGQEARGIEITLAPAPNFCVRGHVVDAGNRRPVPGAMVRIMPHRPGLTMLGGPPNLADEQGAFEIRAVTPGEYSLTTELDAAGKRYRAQLQLTVPDADVEGIELILTAGLELRGRLRAEGEAAVRFTDLHVAAHPRSGMGGLGAQVAPDGSFLIQGITPGPSTIGVSGPLGDLYLKSARLGNKEVLETGFDLTPAETASLELLLSADGGRIDGVVLDNQQRPFPGALVMLLPEASRRSRVHLHRGSNTDQNGRFTIRGIAPGEYLLCAWEDPPHREIIRECERAGQTCWVAPAGAQTVSLRLIPRSQSPVGH